MGAFDLVSGIVPCPACGTLFHLHAQTSFFAPDFAGYHGRAFTVGAPQPIDFDPGLLAAARTWEDQWWRVREPRGGDELSLLADFDELISCHCGAGLALVFDFALAAGPPPCVTLTAFRALDARDPATPTCIDFANAERVVPWKGDFAVWCADVAALAAEETAVRERILSETLAKRFSKAAYVTEPWTIVTGPMRCASCAEIAERTVHTLFTGPDLSESFFGPSWTGGLLRPGARIPVDIAALDDGHDRGAYVRLRPPAARTELVILERKSNWECRCGAGRVHPCLRFAFAPGALVLDSLEARVVRGEADLDAIDFASAPWLTGALKSPGTSSPSRQLAALNRAERVQRLLDHWA